TGVIEVNGVTKRYGERVAVDNLTFTVHPGAVTGFLGPNGAGKSTTMRLILGLDRPTAGAAPVNGRHDAEHAAPLREVGALLAAEGRTVFVSSHLMSEMALTADHLIVVGKGKLIANASMNEFTDVGRSVRVRAQEASRLRDLLVGPDVTVDAVEPGVIQVHGL